MAWTIEYTDTARTQLRKLDRQTARRVLDYMDQRVGTSDDPRGVGRRLSGPLGGLWRYRVGDCRMICDIQDAAVRVLVLRIGNRREVYR